MAVGYLLQIMKKNIYDGERYGLLRTIELNNIRHNKHWIKINNPVKQQLNNNIVITTIKSR